MKRITLLILLLASVTVFGQIPNSGFENWTLINGIEEPDSWVTENDPEFPQVIQNDDAYEGDFAMTVRAVPTGLGAFGSATTTIPIDYIPTYLQFYMKSSIQNGVVIVSVEFYNEDFLFNTFSWDTTATVTEWTFISLEMPAFEPVLTHAVVRVEGIVGDFAPGTAEISVDQMDFSLLSSTDSENVEENIQVYPNPASSFIRIDGLNGAGTVEIFDPSGKRILERNYSGETLVTDLTHLPDGLYLVRVSSDNGEVATRKILID